MTTLEIFGQPPVNIYTQICLCYKLDTKSRDKITHTLQSGLVTLSKSFPWIAGQVVQNTVSGLYEIVAYAPTPKLVIKDASNSFPDFETLQNAHFPFSLLDETLLAPRSTIPGVFSDSKENPVFQVQATFIENGLLLTFLGQHQVMDGTGLAQIMSLYDKACKNVEFSQNELTTGNLERSSIVPLFSKTEKAEFGDLEEKLNHQIMPESTPIPSPEGPKLSWKYVEFSGESLSQLKSLAAQNLSPEIAFISTDDTLTAFIWQVVSRARLQRLGKGHKTTLARAINVRQCLNIPETFPGMLTNMAYNDNTLEEINTAPLGLVASKLRSKLDKDDLSRDTRALATLISENIKKPITGPCAKMDMSSDIALSSWMQQNSYSLDFGLELNTPVSVRRPQFTEVESLMYLLPKTKKGGVTVAVCLRDEDMDFLRSDKDLNSYGVFVE